MQKSKNKVLIIDDYISNLQIFGKILSRGAYKVETSESGFHAIELLEGGYVPDVILLDLMMPVMDGYTFKREINKNPLWSEIPVIIISALDEQVNKSEAFELGCVDFMVKPISKNELLHRVNVQVQYKDQKQELVNINERLIKANNYREKIFSVISHDLRSSIGNLKNVFQYILDGMIDLEEDKELIVDAEISSRNTYNLLENLLFWAKSQQGQIHFLQEEVNLLKEVSIIVDVENGSIINKKINLNIDIPSDIFVLVDGVLLTIILKNLIVNAIKFTKLLGQINITAKLNEQQVICCIEDDGIGLSKEQIEKIHNEISFTSLGTEHEKGTGLGLILVNEFVRQCGGELLIESYLGKGSKFCVVLPLKTE